MNIFFSGIGGVGIGPLAEIALDAGYGVQGSDLKDSPLTDTLAKRGVPIAFTQDGTYLEACHEQKPLDWYVHTAALPSDHPELQTAQRLGIKTAKRDELLAQIIQEKNLKLIAVSGTHGKTTTTGMMVWTMKQLGIPVSYSVGTTLSFGPSGQFDPKSEYFVYECDEFDRNFLHFSPYLAILTSVDYDHPDVYPTKDDYTAAFRQFIGQSQMTIMWHRDNDGIQATAKNGWVLGDDEIMDIDLPGSHNRHNATLVVKAAEYLNLGPTEKTTAILDRFPGTDRRFERLADNLYSDYGHHPAEIAATLQLARELSPHVVLVYQPHQNVRQHEIAPQYTNCFIDAEQVYWLPTYLSREDPSLPILSPEELTKNITNKSAVHIADLNDELWDHIEQARSQGNLVLGMGAGSIDGWLRDRLN
ncbi:MAG TPA: Mur ligase domain-containing protein [Verrucomicrobiae bacterium]|nr:Mur ligase domain-containing protein [Verrucomicrobiae bacterium]